jgi:hypothetical protein
MSLNDYAIMPLSDYKDACDAVRAKGGSTSQAIKSGELAAAIEAISGGGELGPVETSWADSAATYDIAASDWPAGYTMRRYAFYNNEKIGNVVIPASAGSLEPILVGASGTLQNVKGVAAYAFQNCTGIKSVTLESGILAVGAHAFQTSSSQSTAFAVTLPTGLLGINEDAFRGCNISTINLEACDDECHIGNRAFRDTTTLATVKINAYSVGRSAFYNNKKLKRVWLSSAVLDMSNTSFGDAQFANCTALTDIYCEAAEKPSGWGNYWNYITSSSQATVHWGVSEADFDALNA